MVCRDFILPEICKPYLFFFLQNLFYLIRPSGRLCIDGGAHSVRPLQNHIYHTEEQDPQTHHTYAPRRAVPMGRIPYEKIQPRTDLAVSPGLPFTRPGSLSLISYLFSLISITARCICTQRPPPAPAAPG